MVDRISRFSGLLSILPILLVFVFIPSCMMMRTSKGIAPSSGLIKLQDIRVAEGIDKTIVELESTEPMLYTSFHLSKPDRLVIEMADVTFGQYQDEIKFEKGPVRSIQLASSGKLGISRMEFELDGLVRTEVRPEGLNSIVEVMRLEKTAGREKTHKTEPNGKKKFIFFEDSKVRTEPDKPFLPDLDGISEENINPLPKSTPSPSLADLPAPSATSPGAQTTPKIAEGEKTAVSPPAKFVSALRFVPGKPLQLVVTSDGKLSPNIFFVGKDKIFSGKKRRRLVIDLPNVKSKMKKNRITGDSSFVQGIRVGQHPTKLRLVLDLNQQVTYTWDQKQNELWITLQ